MMPSSLLPSLWIRQSGVDEEPLYSPYIPSPSVAAAAQAVNRSSIAALAFLVWDILITTDEEIKFVWPRPWSYNKAIYFFIRYIPVMIEVSVLPIGTELTPPFHFTPHDCYIWEVYQAVAVSLVLAVVDMILILRVYALYHGNVVMRRIVPSFFLIEIVGMVVGLTMSLHKVTFNDLCLVTNAPRTLIIYAAAAILFQAMLFTVTIYKFILAVRDGWGDVALIVLLIRDGTWAFFLLFFGYTGHVVLYALHDGAYAGILYGWILTIFSFCGYRVLLNLYNLGNSNNGELPSTSTPTNTNIQFSTQCPTAATSNSYKLTPRRYASSSGGQKFQNSHISTLSLEP